MGDSASSKQEVDAADKFDGGTEASHRQHRLSLVANITSTESLVRTEASPHVRRLRQFLAVIILGLLIQIIFVYATQKPKETNVGGIEADKTDIVNNLEDMLKRLKFSYQFSALKLPQLPNLPPLPQMPKLIKAQKSANQTTLTISSEPSGATIIVNGEATNQTTPTTIESISDKTTISIMLKKPGFEDYSVILSTGLKQDIVAALEPVRK